jgi:membrane associated rhomboid family serine protease
VFPLKDNVPTRAFPVVTVALIAINFAVWIFYQLPDLNGSVAQLAYQPCEVVSSCPAGTATGASWEVTWLTSMFMHGSWLHIIGNMLFLWIFGNNVEDALGRVRFLLWYLAAGVVAMATQTVVTLHFGTTQDASIPNIGASGAIAAVLGAYFVLLPRARVLTLIFFFIFREIRAVWFLGIWIGLQIWQGGAGLTHPDQTGGVAVFAHIGGFAFGFLTVKLVAQRRPLQPAY